MHDATMDTREWLISNGTGSFASGTVADAHTRTYHGWLIASLQPPVQQTLLLSHIEASLYLAGNAVDLGSNFWTSGNIHPQGFELLQSFSPLPVPTWVWGEEDWQISRQIAMPFGLTSYLSIDDFCEKRWLQQAEQAQRSSKSDSESSSNAVAVQPFTHASSSKSSAATISNRVLVRYSYQGSQSAILTLRPLIGDRSFHQQQRSDSDLQFSQLVNTNSLSLQAIRQNWVGTPWTLTWTRGTYYPDGAWYWNFLYPEETRRGLGDTEDLFSPGYLVVALEPGASVTLEAQIVWPPPSTSSLNDTTFDRLLHIEHSRIQQLLQPLHNFSPRESLMTASGELLTSPASTALTLDKDSIRETRSDKESGLEPKSDSGYELESIPDLSNETRLNPSIQQLKERLWQAGDRFIVYRHSVEGASILAGYPWFSDWSRDTLVALPGLTLTTGRFDVARDLLQTFAGYCHEGLMPNAFPNDNAHLYFNNLDVSLWWVETLGLYVEASQDWAFLMRHYPTVQRIYKKLTVGTLKNIHVDASDGLLTWNAPREALTWMDVVVDREAITPRSGKAIEINGLWYSMLCWAQYWAEWICENTDSCPTSLKSQGRRYGQQAAQVKESLRKFWNAQRGYFHDCIGSDDEPDPSIRPNALIALSLSHCGFAEGHARQALLMACDRLLTPYGLRSLDRAHPAYQGKYAGNLYHRDRAYHQGTVWSWLLGPFIRSWKRFLPEEPLPIDGNTLLEHFQNQACFDSISEIFDGDAPHDAEGAVAQAWSVAELIRHWDDIFSDSSEHMEQ